MNDSFLYHAFGIRDMHYRSTRYKGNSVIITLGPKERLCLCPKCGGKSLVKNGTRTRNFTGLPIGGKHTVFRCVLQRYRCRAEGCGFDRQQEISFAKGSRSYIRRPVPYAMDLLKTGTVRDVANLLGLGWDTVKEMHREYLSSRYGTPSLKGVSRMGIDEFAVRKGHVYKTIVVDLDTDRILHVGNGKGSDALDGFWRRAKRCGVDIKVVTIDMSAAFFASVVENAPNARIVFDRFHVVRLMNESVDKVRRDAYRNEKDKAVKKSIKGTKWLLMANREDLEESDGGTARLDQALELNRPLFEAYYLKEELREVWLQTDKKDADRKLTEWVESMKATGNVHLIKTASTVMAYRSGILSWYDHRISNAKVEGINNKIKVLKRMAYGFRDDDYFKLRLFALHDARITRNVG